MSQLEEQDSPSNATRQEELPSELGHLFDGARDALTDDMVTRLSATATEGLELLDRINRSGISEALPVLAQMVESGDLERVANMVRLAGSAQDALTDDIVARMAQTAGDSLDLLDRVNRSGVADALPAITALVSNGDLDRLIGLARLVGSAQDALSDDVINRLSLIASELMCLADRLARNPNFFQLVDLLGRNDVQSTLVTVLNGLVQAREDVAGQPPTKGGLGALLAIARDPGTLETLRFASAFGYSLRTRNTQE